MQSSMGDIMRNVFIVLLSMGMVREAKGFPGVGKSMLAEDETSARPDTIDDGHRNHGLRHHGHNPRHSHTDEGNHGNITMDTYSHIKASSLRAGNSSGHLEHRSSSQNKESLNNTRIFLMKLFEKYGHKGKITLEGMEHLLESLGLGGRIEFDHKLSLHHENGEFKNLHVSHDHLKDPDEKLSEVNENAHDHDDSHHNDHDDHRHDSHEHNDSQYGSQGENSHQHTQENRSDSSIMISSPRNAGDEECMDSISLLGIQGLSAEDDLDLDDFKELCPVLIFELDGHKCGRYHEDKGDPSNQARLGDESVPQAVTDHAWTDAQKWGYSILSCAIISGLSLAGAPLIPLMNRVFYNHLLQFMVAMAIGTLSGDALLHLIPHAISPHDHSGAQSRMEQESVDDHHDHNHSNHGGNHGDGQDHKRSVWLGLTALGGIYIFFLVERVMGALTTWKRKRNSKKSQSHSPPRDNVADEEETLEKQTLEDRKSRVTSCEGIMMVVHTSKDVRKIADEAHQEVHGDCETEEAKGEFVHSHAHGHHHYGNKVPGSVAAVAWMVIMGDGVHNFSDGLAIGAAFAESMSSGISTSIAVFCHEVPHELGDFAVLLTAGMTIKQALFYNFVSALLSLLGNIIGVALGNLTNITPWILCLIAGMFLYVALVDMLPELTNMTSKEGEPALFHLVIQNIGLILGACIMLLIAVFEEQITF